MTTPTPTDGLPQEHGPSHLSPTSSVAILRCLQTQERKSPSIDPRDPLNCSRMHSILLDLPVCCNFSSPCIERYYTPVPHAVNTFSKRIQCGRKFIFVCLRNPSGRKWVMAKIAPRQIGPEHGSAQPVSRRYSAAVPGKVRTYYSLGPQDLAEHFSPFFRRQT